MKTNGKSTGKTNTGATAARTGLPITESDLSPELWKAIDGEAEKRGVDAEATINAIVREWVETEKEVKFFKMSKSKKEFEAHTMTLKLRPDVWGLLVIHAMNYETDVETYLNDYLNRSDLD